MKRFSTKNQTWLFAQFRHFECKYRFHGVDHNLAFKPLIIFPKSPVPKIDEMPV